MTAAEANTRSGKHDRSSSTQVGHSNLKLIFQQRTKLAAGFASRNFDIEQFSGDSWKRAAGYVPVASD
jgi:hypothetical protein